MCLLFSNFPYCTFLHGVLTRLVNDVLSQYTYMVNITYCVQCALLLMFKIIKEEEIQFRPLSKKSLSTPMIFSYLNLITNDMGKMTNGKFIINFHTLYLICIHIYLYYPLHEKGFIIVISILIYIYRRRTIFNL